jgi:biofilm protein TabA
MKMLKRPTLAVLLCALTILLFSLNASAQGKKDKQILKKAFKNQVMLNGTAIVPDSSIDKATFAKQYKANKALWKKAFQFLTTTDLDKMSTGKHLIAGDSLYAIVIDGPTKTPDMVKWESHQNHIDIQCVLKSAETMQLALPASVAPSIPYDPKTDNANFTATVSQSYIATPGKILLFFPGIVHRAGLKAEGYDTDRRVVLKILAAK